MTLARPRAIIFDWDNTLVDTWPVIHEALNNTFRDMGTPQWTFDDTREKVKKSMRDSFPEIFGDTWEKAAELYQNYYRASHLEKLHALPRAEEVLQKIKALGIHNVVVSNKKGPNLRQEIEHLGWTGYFQGIVGANDAARDKPHADPVHLVFEKTDIKPAADVWFIGDSEVDIECAEVCGCTAILYGAEARVNPRYSATHYYDFPYHTHVDDHTQLLALLDF